MLANKTLYQWCQWINRLFVILFSAAACLVDLRIGFAFVLYELIRAICRQIQAEEKLIEEVEHEKHTYL
jgi:hypothetical protein